mgnify:CR=1 FL=1
MSRRHSHPWRRHYRPGSRLHRESPGRRSHRCRRRLAVAVVPGVSVIVTVTLVATLVVAVVAAGIAAAIAAVAVAAIGVNDIGHDLNGCSLAGSHRT